MERNEKLSEISEYDLWEYNREREKTVVEQHIMKAGNGNYPEVPEWHE